MGKTSRVILGLALAAALLPWMAAPWWPTRDPWNDFKWPALAIFLLVAAVLSLSESKSASSKSFSSGVRSSLPFLATVVLILIGLIASAAISPAPVIGI